MKIHYLLFTILLFYPAKKINSQSTSSPILPVLTENGTTTSCPFIAEDSKGNPVLVFGKKTSKNETFLCYSLFDFKKKKFQNPTVIQSSKGIELHGENAPKIIFKPNKEIIAVWGIDNATEKKKYGGLINYSQSFDNGKSWTKAKRLVKNNSSVDQRYFDVDLLPNGEVAIIWLDSRTDTEEEGSTLFYAQTKGNTCFQNEKPIAKTTCQCCRTDLFISKKGVINAAFRDIINDEIRDMVLTYSTDNGKKFSNPKRISTDNWKINGCPHTGPTMSENENGLQFSWYTAGGGSGVFYCNSSDYGKTFSKRAVVSDAPSAKHPQIAALNNKEVLIVWDESRTEGDDFTTQIGLQHRNEKGKIVSTKYISTKNLNSTFPVIKAISKTQFLVAWSQQSANENVFYKILTID